MTAINRWGATKADEWSHATSNVTQYPSTLLSLQHSDHKILAPGSPRTSQAQRAMARKAWSYVVMLIVGDEGIEKLRTSRWKDHESRF